MNQPVPVDDPDAIRRILTDAEALLLDFDGPICSVFAGIGAHNVAEQLRNVLADFGACRLPDEVAHTRDPFDVLRYAATLGPEQAHHVEAAFTAHEIDAIHTATPTPHAHELIHAWHATGRPCAIVSNNSTAAIHGYLILHTLTDYIDHISARADFQVENLKPSTFLLDHAIFTLELTPDSCVFIGDSPSDIEAGNRVGVHTIAYANKNHKKETLGDQHPYLTVTTLEQFDRAAT